MITGEEFERRIRRVSQMRQFTHALRKAAMEAYKEGRIPYRPTYDIRSDYDYWAALAKAKSKDARPASSEKG